MSNPAVADFNSSSLRCRHCGESEPLADSEAIAAFLARLQRFERGHAACPPPAAPLTPPCPDRPLPVSAEALAPWPGLEAWLRHGRVGVSSLTLASAITGLPLEDDPCHPWDGPDFERCRNLLREVPSLAAGLRARATRRALGPDWIHLLDCWDELTTRLDAGVSPTALTPVIKACLGRG